ncbi:TfoX/Sxy family protein [Niabella soli]|uniref:RNA methyltransferase n=1 Tax=Niabella soli DSM 19437 TaxID=929713 RepID=W0EX15_9BACT|nr:TfoX/Sxy family protein [Niabella soli]AHF15365.1 RNA methyltransferase [Niabella soli DSM 19437]
MAYDETLAKRVRAALAPVKAVEEKKMFGGLAFMVRGKMCINISDDRLMCRFDPALEKQIAAKTGYQPMIMRGRVLKGYCLVDAGGYQKQKGFDFWIKLVLDFNARL